MNPVHIFGAHLKGSETINVATQRCVVSGICRRDNLRGRYDRARKELANGSFKRAVAGRICTRHRRWLIRGLAVPCDFDARIINGLVDVSDDALALLGNTFSLTPPSIIVAAVVVRIAAFVVGEAAIWRSTSV
jgi:hypothetical protein